MVRGEEVDPVQRGTMRDSRGQVRRIAWAALCVALAARAGGATTKGPDAAGYVATDSTVYSFVDIAGASGGASVLADTDDGMAALTLPFPFQFYGQAYTIVCVSSNGAMYFVGDPGGCAFNDFANVDITAVVPPGDRPALMPLWSDLTFQAAGGGAVFYQAVGAPGHRSFVVQWNNAYPQGSSNPVTFQVVLSEPGNVLFQYKTIALGAANPAAKGALATVGIRNAAGLANARQIAWSYQAPVIGDNSALLFSAGDSSAPITTAAVSGPVGSNGWYRGPVQVTLTSTDAGGAVASTTYSLDGGATVPYTAPFAVSGDGIHSLSFFSVDGSGNTESPNTLALKIDGTAPTVTAAALPTSLWPPDGRTVPVTVSGTVADATSGVDPTSARFSVVDEYGQVQPTGAVSIGSGGHYTAAVSLPASRNGNDNDGRTYTIVVRVLDNAGNLATASALVRVPHDEGHD
jgi:hypothetical protein